MLDLEGVQTWLILQHSMKYFLQYFILYFKGNPVSMKTLLSSKDAACSVKDVAFLHFLHRAFQPAKNAFVDILRAVIADVKFFLVLLVITIWGFACSFYILFRQDQKTQVRLIPCPTLPTMVGNLRIMVLVPPWQ